METDNPLIHELFEANSELARHHRDFERIRDIVDKVLKEFSVYKPKKIILALKEIRNIVG